MSGTLFEVSAPTFTRPADVTAYAANDLVANSTTAGSVTPLAFVLPTGPISSFVVRSVRIVKSTTTTANASFTLHLYGSSPTCANGDNGAWSTDVADWHGFLALGTSGVKAFTDGAVCWSSFAEGADIHHEMAPSSRTIYGLLMADAAYTPGNAETFTVEIHVEGFR